MTDHIETLLQRIAELEEEIADRDAAYAAVIEERCASDERHCACVPHLRQRIAELERHESFYRVRCEKLQARLPASVRGLRQRWRQ